MENGRNEESGKMRYKGTKGEIDIWSKPQQA